MRFFNPSQAKLKKYQSLSVIASSIAIPLVLGITGYYIQESIAEAQLKKEYVQIAIGILKDGESSHPDLKKWAVEVVQKNSPVPFSNDLSNKLRMGATLKLFAHLNLVPESLMEPPAEILPNTEANNLENYRRSMINAKRLTELQEWVRISHER